MTTSGITYASQIAREVFRLNPKGYHGFGHWGRVSSNAMTLGRLLGADLVVVQLFSQLHDCRRESEGYDTEHGPRAAAWVRDLGAAAFGIRKEQLDVLCEAIGKHSDGHLSDHPTLAACWDADRLDLPRVGVEVDPDRLCSDAARAVLEARQVIAYDWPDMIEEDHGQPVVLWHGTPHSGELDLSHTRDGGIHLGTFEQALMRMSGQDGVIRPFYLRQGEVIRETDVGGDWRQKALRAQAQGKNCITYLNRYEGFPADVLDALFKQGRAGQIDSMSEAQLLKIAPSLSDSYMVLDLDLLIEIPAHVIKQRPSWASRKQPQSEVRLSL